MTSVNKYRKINTWIILCRHCRPNWPIGHYQSLQYSHTNSTVCNHDDDCIHNFRLHPVFSTGGNTIYRQTHFDLPRPSVSCWHHGSAGEQGQQSPPGLQVVSQRRRAGWSWAPSPSRQWSLVASLKMEVERDGGARMSEPSAKLQFLFQKLVQVKQVFSAKTLLFSCPLLLGAIVLIGMKYEL